MCQESKKYLEAETYVKSSNLYRAAEIPVLVKCVGHKSCPQKTTELKYCQKLKKLFDIFSREGEHLGQLTWQ